MDQPVQPRRRNSAPCAMCPVDVAYLAGIIDGEGHIGLERHGKSYSLRLAVHTTSKELAEWILTTTGYGNKVQERRETRSVVIRKRMPTYEWRVFGRQAAQMIGKVRPYLRVRDKQADIALAFQPLYQAAASTEEKRWLGEEARHELKEANLRRARQRYLASRPEGNAVMDSSPAPPTRGGEPASHTPA